MKQKYTLVLTVNEIEWFMRAFQLASESNGAGVFKDWYAGMSKGLTHVANGMRKAEEAATE